jgi:hypothetical protein
MKKKTQKIEATSAREAERIKMAADEVVQPLLYVDKDLYDDYQAELKKAGRRDLTHFNSMIFTRGVQRELEALKHHNAQKQADSQLLSDNYNNTPSAKGSSEKHPLGGARGAGVLSGLYKQHKQNIKKLPPAKD